MNEGGWFRYLYSGVSGYTERTVLWQRKLWMKYTARALYVPVSDEFYSNIEICKAISKAYGLVSLECRRRKTKSTFELKSIARFCYMKTNHRFAPWDQFLTPHQRIFPVLRALVLCGCEMHGNAVFPQDIFHTTRKASSSCVFLTLSNIIL